MERETKVNPVVNNQIGQPLRSGPTKRRYSKVKSFVFIWGRGTPGKAGKYGKTTTLSTPRVMSRKKKKTKLH